VRVAQVNKNRIPLTDNAVIEEVSAAHCMHVILLHVPVPRNLPWHALAGNGVRAEGHAHAPQVLGKHGIICIEDLVHEIHTCGPAFKQVGSLCSALPFAYSQLEGKGVP
jgi:hypothetical protein